MWLSLVIFLCADRLHSSHRYIFCFHSRLWTDDSRKGLAGSQRVPVDFSQLVRWHTLCFSSGALTSVFYSLPEVSQSLSYLDFCSTCMSSRLRPTWAIQIIQAIQMNRQSHLLPSRELSQIRQCILSRLLHRRPAHPARARATECRW